MPLTTLYSPGNVNAVCISSAPDHLSRTRLATTSKAIPAKFYRNTEAACRLRIMLAWPFELLHFRRIRDAVCLCCISRTAMLIGTDPASSHCPATPLRTPAISWYVDVMTTCRAKTGQPGRFVEDNFRASSDSFGCEQTETAANLRARAFQAGAGGGGGGGHVSRVHGDEVRRELGREVVTLLVLLPAVPNIVSCRTRDWWRTPLTVTEHSCSRCIPPPPPPH